MIVKVAVIGTTRRTMYIFYNIALRSLVENSRVITFYNTQSMITLAQFSRALLDEIDEFVQVQTGFNCATNFPQTCRVLPNAKDISLQSNFCLFLHKVFELASVMETFAVYFCL